jgi:hypothetical protein
MLTAQSTPSRMPVTESATVVPHPVAVPITISFKWLLALYAILPVCFLAGLIDKYYFNSKLQPLLPLAPENYFWLALLFGTPHILASNIILLSNREYFVKYRQRLALVTLLIIAFFGIGYFVLSYNVLFALVATTTVIHVVKQQIGIGNSLARLSGPVFQCWAWSVIGTGVVLYNAIFLNDQFTDRQHDLLYALMLGLSALTIFLACICFRRIKTPLAKAFFVGNSALSIVSVVLYREKYYFFAVLGPRVIHDVTAFIFYVAHDYNRHHTQPRNGLYKVFNKLNVSAFLAVPLMAVGATYLLQVYGNPLFDAVTLRLFNVRIPNAITLGFIGYLSLLHYYTEAFTWKGDSPYKRYIAFKRPG